MMEVDVDYKFDLINNNSLLVSPFGYNQSGSKQKSGTKCKKIFMSLDQVDVLRELNYDEEKNIKQMGMSYNSDLDLTSELKN